VFLSPKVAFQEIVIKNSRSSLGKRKGRACGIPGRWVGKVSRAGGGLGHAPTGTGHFHRTPVGPAWVPSSSFRLGPGTEKIPEGLHPGKRFLPGVWGGRGGADAAALLSTASLGWEKGSRKGN